MRKLSDNALRLVMLINHVGGSWCPNDTSFEIPGVPEALDEIIRKKRAFIEETDGGPRYHLTQAGVNEAEGVDAQVN